MWGLSFGIAVGILLYMIVILLIFRKNNQNTFTKTLWTMLIGVFAASVVLFFPMFADEFEHGISGIFKTCLISVHNTIRLFVVDTDFNGVLELSEVMDSRLYMYYTALAAVLYVSAPLLTCSVIMSFFKSILNYYSLLIHYNRDMYIFSELSECSVTLAESIREHHKDALLIFAGMADMDNEKYEYRDRAYQLKVHCLKKDITALHFKYHSKKSKMYFFLIGEDEGENVESALQMIKNYKSREHTRLYVFASALENEILLNSVPHEKLKVRRIDMAQSMIYQNLYDKGTSIYDGAAEKRISVVLMGLGYYGLDMLKAMAWFGQMDGYHISIDAYDKNPNAGAIVSRACPELISPEKNGTVVDGEAEYEIRIHEGIDVFSEEFAKSIETLEHPTYVFVALGEEHRNMETALYLRTAFAKKELNPKIQVVFYKTYDAGSLEKAKNFKKQSYDIEVVGDVKSMYSEDVILNSELEKKALQRHLKWGIEQEFWAYEYNYRSSIACEIHKKMKCHCQIPGADVPVEKRSDEEKEIVRKLEHKRWNAYMRSEGYCYGEERDDMAKTHPCLVPYDELPEHEKKKDDD